MPEVDYLYTAADVRRRVARICGTPDELAARLRATIEMMARRGRMPRGEESEFLVEIAALRRALRERFAERHGWRYTKRKFGPGALARRRVSGGFSWTEQWCRSIADHPYRFRTPDGRAAALVAHLYSPSLSDREEIEAWAREVGLRVEFPADFPSWWYPGHTTLCVYTPAARRFSLRAVAGPSVH